MDIVALTFFLGFGFILLGVTLLAFAASFFDAHQISQRLQKYVSERAEDSRTRGFGVQDINFSESLVRRTLITWFNSLLSFFGQYTPANTIQDINRQLSLAGTYGIRAQQYYGIRFLLILLGIGWMLFSYDREKDLRILVANSLIILILFLIPILWLRMRVAKRQNQIRKSLPDSLDMLSVCASAGLGFDQALLRVSQYFATATGAEFGRVVAEMEVGVSRAQALRNFSDRVGISEISSFVAVIIQSDQLGMSIADVLHSQAEQMRMQRQYRTKEAAQRLPVKMMIPLAFLILPALLAVLLGPTVPAILEIF